MLLDGYRVGTLSPQAMNVNRSLTRWLRRVLHKRPAFALKSTEAVYAYVVFNSEHRLNSPCVSVHLFQG
jgi:hypothetical protein